MHALWPHQRRGIDDVLAAVARGERRICLTSPTGMGKTTMMAALAKHYLDQGKRVVIYTNRKLLVEQTSARLGLDHGVRAAGHQDNRDLPLQVSSIQTEDARVFKREAAGKLGAWALHPADLVLLDECHAQGGEVAQAVVGRHLEAGAAVVGVTATPLGVGHMYSTLIQAGTTAEGRACGALVAAAHFGPDEPDLRQVTKSRLAPPTDRDLTEPEVRKLFPPTQFLFARVLDWYGRLNPGRRPAILFAPGVPESLWFAEEFTKAGVKAAHIDGDGVWVAGVTYDADRRARDDVFAAFKAGEVKVLCNRFVLREGLDLPEVEHLILATVFGSLTAYLQSGGRGLRASPATGKTRCVVQDHGGNWWRHGSLNADRHWHLAFDPAAVAGMRAEAIREGREKEPARCPKCAQVLAGLACPCGWELSRAPKSRPVVQSDGTLRDQTGDAFVPRRRTFKPDTMTLWTKCYYRAKNGRMTFRQAEGLFFQENGYWPPRTLPLMPRDASGWFRRVADVPREELASGTRD